MLSWNEISDRAVQFAMDWQGAKREEAEAQSFWNDFFNVFGVRRRTVASFEEKVQNIKGRFGFIDLFWRGKMLVEHKSLGQSLDKAASQAFEYIQCLKDESRDDEIPRYVVVSDFANIVLYDLEAEDDDLPMIKFPLREFPKHIHDFAFIPGYKVHRFKKEDTANIKAAELMGNIHDALVANGYGGHNLERFLVRILFCLFAEDTGIFEPNAFTIYIEQSTREDGLDLGSQLGILFDVLDTPEGKRQKNLDENLVSMRYVNGGLFEETLRVPACNRSIRDAVLIAARFDWSRISPAVFGSLFQSVMDPDGRRRCGAHYTSELDILKVIQPLFLDELRDEFKKVKTNKRKLQEFHRKLASLTFFDPACGCGNFLILAYREIRRLEMDVLQAIYKKDAFDLLNMVLIDVNQFYGIEIQEFPVRIAETVLWIMDHQMNVETTERFHRYYIRLPLQKTPTIFLGNALRVDWNEILPNKKCSYMLGNPPYVGKHLMDKEQSDELDTIFHEVKGHGLLDYVSCWYYKAAQYIQETSIRVGFVSTNSITQGEQVEVLWRELFKQKIIINFAYPTFVWTSEARGKAHVHCVIIGFSLQSAIKKRLFDEHEGTFTDRIVQNISPYLIEGSDLVLPSRSKPICDVPEIIFGSKSVDGGFLMLSNDEKKEFLKQYPECASYVRPMLGSEEFINGIKRWCLWLEGVNPKELFSNSEIKRRVEAVKQFRLASKKETTKRDAEIPTLFTEIRQPQKDYLVIPKTSSEKRKYVPMGFVKSNVIANTGIFALPGTTLFHFGILTSTMHMDWMRRVCGRLKSDYRYSAKLVYNNFPWPENLSIEKRKRVEEKAQSVLDARKQYPANTLADLYAADFMPKKLVKAHRELDRAVERCYRSKLFKDDQERLAFLFELYEKLTATEK